MRGIKRTILILCSLVSFFMLTGFTLIQAGVVKLRTEQPVIDLSVEIKDSKPGNGGEEEHGVKEEGSSEEAESKKNEENSGNEPETAAEAEPEKVDITITVSDDFIIFDGKPIKNISELEKVLKAVYRKGMTVYLTDSYAEYRTYSEIIRLLKNADIEPVLIRE